MLFKYDTLGNFDSKIPYTKKAQINNKVTLYLYGDLMGAYFEDKEENSNLTVKWCGSFHSCRLLRSPLDIVAWHGNYAPWKYDLRNFSPVSAVLFDHPDPSIYTVLTSPSGIEGTANIDFILFVSHILFLNNQVMSLGVFFLAF